MDYLGIDVAKRKLDCVIISGSKVSKCKTFDNTPRGFKALRSWIDKTCKDEVRIGVEATGSYHEAVTEFLADQGLYISVINPAKVKRYSECVGIRNSVDSVCAYIIADFCRARSPRAWVAPAPGVRELKELTRRLYSLEQSRQEEKNKLEANPRSKSVVESIKRSVKRYDKEILVIEKEIRKHVEAYPELNAQCELLQTISCLGFKTAAILLSEMPAIENLENAKQLAAYVGLSPMQHQSGSSVLGKTRLCKAGNSRLRGALYFPAMSAVRYNTKLRAFYKKLVAAGKNKKSALCAVMRKLLHIVYGVLSHGTPFRETTECKAEKSNPPTPQSSEEAVGGDAVKARHDHRLGLGRVASDCYNPCVGGVAALPDPVEIAC